MLDSVLASWNKMTTPTADRHRIIAAIDLGTNSLHMVVVEIEPTLPSFSIIGKEKETVRLGNRDPETGNLKPEVIERAINALARFQEIAKTLDAEAIIAVATSAVREAPNGMDFLEQVKTELGLDVDLISGQEEARRIYLGVLSGMEFSDRPHIIIDIGGGSTELILCDSQEEKVLSSTKVGAVRLTKEFIASDPISDSEFDYLQAYTRGMLERAVDQIKVNLRGKEYPCLVGTSGTIEAIAAIDAREKFNSEPSTLNGYEFTLSDLHKWVHRFRKMDNAERAEIPGMPDKRSEVILAGAIVLQEAMALLNVWSITICERALREGVIVDWMLSNGLIENSLRYQSSVRERSIVKAAQKFQVNTEHSDRIAIFALSLFDQTQYTLHDWDTKARELLWAAAILHNCGYYVSHSAHHKHSYYLIRNCELLGYNETEIEIIANLARYHRKSAPKKKHENYRNLLHKEHRELISQLSSLLRIATALDKRQNGAIAKVDCEYDSKKREFRIELFPSDINDDCDLELWSLDYSKTVFEEEFDVKVSTCLGSSLTVNT